MPRGPQIRTRKAKRGIEKKGSGVSMVSNNHFHITATTQNTTLYPILIPPTQPPSHSHLPPSYPSLSPLTLFASGLSPPPSGLFLFPPSSLKNDGPLPTTGVAKFSGLGSVLLSPPPPLKFQSG